MATHLAEVDNHNTQYISAKGRGMGLQPPLFQTCELGGLASYVLYMC